MVDISFLVISVLTVVCAIASLELRSLIYGSIALMGSLLGIAFFFLIIRCTICSYVSSSCLRRVNSSIDSIYCDVG